MLARLPEDAARAILQRSALRLLTTHTVTELPRLLSILEQTRKRGYAVNNQETFVGDISIAAAIVDQAGRVAGAINIAAPSPRYSLTALERALANDLMRTAGEVSRSLGVA
jgi:DNA-binding IclR family transcriptional regulator